MCWKKGGWWFRAWVKGFLLVVIGSEYWGFPGRSPPTARRMRGLCFKTKSTSRLCSINWVVMFQKEKEKIEEENKEGRSKKREIKVQ